LKPYAQQGLSSFPLPGSSVFPPNQLEGRLLWFCAWGGAIAERAQTGDSDEREKREDRLQALEPVERLEEGSGAGDTGEQR
jgi:hypothetical protein